MNKWDVGDVVRLSVAFTSGGDAVDPDNVAVRVRTPSGTESSVAVVRTAAGNYTADITVNEPGVWWYRVSGEGDASSASEHSFLARTRRVGA